MGSLYTSKMFDPPEKPEMEPQPEDTPEVEPARTHTLPVRLVYDEDKG